jgi:hypothetical protein
VKSRENTRLQGFRPEVGDNRGTLAWAAGLYVGEGTATRCGGYLRLGVKMTNEVAVRPSAPVVRCGTVYGPYNYHYRDGCVRKPHWIWVALRDDALSSPMTSDHG